MKIFRYVLVLMFIAVNVDCLNLTKRYFLTLNMDTGSSPVNIRKTLKVIRSQLCSSKDGQESSVRCFLKFKVVAEPRVIVVVDVEDSAELERRLFVLLDKRNVQLESEPLVDYGDFAEFLGVNSSLINQVKGNTLKKKPEVLWCEYNINFGDKYAAETLDIWKREAEFVFQTRNSGVPLEVFKTLGERTVHVLGEAEATAFDQLLFGTPFTMEIANTVRTTCKTGASFEAVLKS